MSISELQKLIHSSAREKGWYDRERSLAELLVNVHGEVSEAWEDYRNGLDLTQVMYAGEDQKPVGFPTELADIVIRTLDTAEYLGIDLQEVIDIKMDYNSRRAYRHGNKLA